MLSRATGQSRIVAIGLVIAALACFCAGAMAAPKFARTTGNWSTAGNWSSVSCAAAGATTAPTAADDVTICNNITITVNVASQAGSVTIATGANASGLTLNNSLTVTNASGGSGNVTINGSSGGVTRQIAVGTQTLTVTGNVAINGGSSNNSSSQINVSTGKVTVNGNVTLTGGTTATRDALLTVTGAPAVAGNGINIDGNLSIVSSVATSSTVSIGAANGVINVGGNVTNGDTLTVGAGLFSATNAASTFRTDNSGNTTNIVTSTTVTSGTLSIAGNAIVAGGTANPSGATMSVTTGAINISGDLSITAGSNTNTSATASVTTGRITVGGTTTVTGGAEAGRNALLTASNVPAASPSMSLGNLTIVTSAAGGVGTGAVTMTAAGVINVSGNVNNGGTVTIGTGAFNVTGASSTYDNNSAVVAATTTISSGSLNLSGATPTLSIATGDTMTVSTTGSITVGNPATDTGTVTNAGTITLTAGGTFTANGDFTSSGTFTNTAAGQLALNGGSSSISGTFNRGTGTVTMGGSATQDLSASGLTLNNLTINNTSGVTLSSNVAVAGTLNMNGAATVLTPAAGVVVSGAGTLTGTGTVQVTRVSGTNDFSTQYTITNKTFTNLTVEYAGASAQQVSNVAYTRLKINNPSGVSLPGADVTATTLLTLTSGAVTTSTNNLIVSTATCPGSVSRTGGWVAGNLRLSVPGGGASPTCVWDIGDSAGYRPFTIAFTNVTTAGTVTAQVSQAAGDHPNIGTSTSDSALTVNRYWTITSATTVFASATATFTWLGGDVDSGADQASFVIGRYNAGWTYFTTTPGSNTASSAITAAQMPAPRAWPSSSVDCGFTFTKMISMAAHCAS